MMKKKAKTSDASPVRGGVAEEVLPARKKTRQTAKHDKPSPNGNGNGKTNGKVHTVAPKDFDYYNELDSRELLKVLSEVRNGNFTVRMPVDKLGISGKIC